MAHAAGRTVGLDGVPGQQHNYRRSGFLPAHTTIRYSGVPGGEVGAFAAHDRTASHGIVPLDDVDLSLLGELDAACHPADRQGFATGWAADSRHTARARFRDGLLTGYGVLRPAEDGRRIGPLLATTPRDAEALLGALLAEAGREKVSIDIPEPHRLARRMAERFGLAPSSSTARMYTGPIRTLQQSLVYGVMSPRARLTPPHPRGGSGRVASPVPPSTASTTFTAVTAVTASPAAGPSSATAPTIAPQLRVAATCPAASNRSDRLDVGEPVQVPGDRGDGDGALAHRRPDALDRSGAHVARREDAGDGGLREQRRAPLGPRFGQQSGAPQHLRVGEDESELVDGDDAAHPLRRRHGAEHDVQLSGGDRLGLTADRLEQARPSPAGRSREPRRSRCRAVP